MQHTLQAIAYHEYSAMLARYLRPHRGKVAGVALLLLATIALQLIAPQLVRRFIDAAEQGQPLRILLELALLFLGAAVAKYLLALALTYLSEEVGWRTTNQLRADLTAHCLRLDLPFHQTHAPGLLIERIDGDVGLLARFFSQLVIQLLGNGLLLLGILGVLSGEDWRLGLAFALFVAGALAILFRLRNFATPHLQAERAASADLFGFLEERLHGLEELHANGATDHTIRALLSELRTLWRKGMAARPRNAIFGSVIVIWFEAGTALALALGAWLFLRNSLTIGTVYLLYAYLRMVSTPLLRMTGEIQQLQEATAAISRVRELLAIPRRVLDGPQQQLPAGPLAVRFANVTFHYEPDSNERAATETAQSTPAVLHELSLTVPAGRTLGLLGRTGSGKSTISRLLLRFYDPQTGAITLNGVDLRELALPALRRHVGIVTQEVQLFHASVRDNLTLFDPQISDAAVAAAIDAVGLTDWLQKMPAGLDSELRADGGSLSAGEAQLLAFARVLLKDPGLVILDEAASRLDPATEARLNQAIATLLHNRTAIVIAHRLATIEQVDDLLILDNGRVQEYGSRAHLAADPTSRFAQLLRTGLAESEETA